MMAHSVWILHDILHHLCSTQVEKDALPLHPTVHHCHTGVLRGLHSRVEVQRGSHTQPLERNWHSDLLCWQTVLLLCFSRALEFQIPVHDEATYISEHEGICYSYHLLGSFKLLLTNVFALGSLDSKPTLHDACNSTMHLDYFSNILMTCTNQQHIVRGQQAHVFQCTVCMQYKLI